MIQGNMYEVMCMIYKHDLKLANIYDFIYTTTYLGIVPGHRRYYKTVLIPQDVFFVI